MLECNHPFHTNCISQLRSNKCPSCRRRFTQISPKILSPILQRENSDTLSRNTENLNNFINTTFAPSDIFLLFQNALRASAEGGVRVSLPQPPPPPNLFGRPAEPRQPSDVIALLMRLLFRNVYPIIVTLLNTPFQGITLNAMLEDYLARQTCGSAN